MSRWTEYVIDASMGWGPCVCPIEGDIDGEFSVVVGMNHIGYVPPGGRLVAIWHPDGQGAVEEFCDQWADELEVFKKSLPEIVATVEDGE